MQLAKKYQEFLPDFIQSMPVKGQPTVWLPKASAIQCERFKGYLNDRHFLMVDHDHAPCRAEKLYDIEPNIVIYNPQNPERHQAFWWLKDPVYCQISVQTSKAYRYLRAVEAAYDERYGADVHFARCIHKNPLHWLSDTDWRHDRAYSLSELAEVVDLNPHRVKNGKRLVTDGGRNTTLFNDLRFWARRNVGTAKERPYEEWHEQVITRAIALNTFENPLGLREVLTVARSVAEHMYYVAPDYCNSPEYTEEQKKSYAERQAARGAIGGKKSRGGGRPPVIDAETSQRIELMLSMNYSYREIADRLEISKSVVNNYANLNVK